MAPRYIQNLIPKIREELSVRLNIIEKDNIEKITGRTANINGILKELRENIESENHWATFYLTQIISERIKIDYGNISKQQWTWCLKKEILGPA